MIKESLVGAQFRQEARCPRRDSCINMFLGSLCFVEVEELRPPLTFQEFVLKHSASAKRSRQNQLPRKNRRKERRGCVTTGDFL